MSAEYGGSEITKAGARGGGFFFGVLLFLGSFPLLFWNEGRAVLTAKALEEGQGIVVSMPSPAPNPANEGKLVHFTGSADTYDELTDGYSGIKVNAIKLHRSAEMYQWKEEKRKEGEKTSYYYDKTWSGSLISSGSFHNQDYNNPGTMKVTGETYVAKNVFVGEFNLSAGLIGSIRKSTPLNISADIYEQLPESVRAEAHHQPNGFYIGEDPNNPQIGDIRVTYSVYQEQPVSVVAKQIGNSAVAYITSNGRELEILHSGIKTAEQVFQTEHTKNNFITWVFRVGGMFAMYVGLMLSVGQVARLFSWIPMLGTLVETGVAIIAGLLALAFSFATISVAWIFYRPVVGAALLAVSAAAVWLMMKKAKDAQPAPASGARPMRNLDPPPPPPPPIP